MIHLITGKIDGNGIDVVTLDGEPLDVTPSLRLRKHSPTGFAWGYGGSGPAQLALAILLKVVSESEALKWYGVFKWRVIAAIPMGNEFSISIDIAEELARYEREEGSR